MILEEVLPLIKMTICYVTGFFTGTISLDSFQIASDGFFEDIFLTKLDEQGKILWAQKAGGVKIDEAHGIAVDEKGNSYAAGFFVGEFFIDTPATEINVYSPQNLSSHGDRDIFIVKYDSEGKFQWARNAGGAGIDEGRAICSLPSGGCYVTGFFANNASFGDTVISDANDHDVFIAHYSPDGNLVSIKKTGSSGYDEGRSIIADGMGNVYLTGNYHGIPDFGNSKLPESRGDGDVFVLKIISTIPYRIFFKE